MSIFSKIKDNFTQGGVDVTLTLRDENYIDTGLLNYSIDVVSKDDMREVEYVSVEVVGHDSSSDSSARITEHRVAKEVLAENITLNPSEQRHYEGTINLKEDSLTTEGLPPGIGLLTPGVGEYYEALDYSITAYAKVKDIFVNAQSQKRLNLRKNGISFKIISNGRFKLGE